MNKIIFLILTTFIFSCNAYKSTTELTWLGMTKQEFTKAVKYPTLDLAYDGVEVYRKTKRVVRGGMARYETHFFYFKNNKLIKIDTGVEVNPKEVIDLNINNN